MEWIILPVILIILIVFAVVRSLSQRRYLKTLTEEEFRSNYRKAQIIDVREPNEFDNGHILGARNIPLTQMKMRKSEVRKDKPVYLYCANGFRSNKAAAILKKAGCQDLNQLKGGFKKWSGKVKKS
ncbi:rhodanese-related sulfurtransferase [Scopulibacillus darangshiensis]|uniref:Rhodanese-related sulfurtransferase n=1 Tax=Scopulibacillus darangshiensis TaxID=442528 RepID=A0A4R2PA83_9BACL|nr:rhodanese-like domain-containing protein [Scopulibacillus darangshiensis]TCP31164.1 rhodanese-related sulfurtransferase [Scopulibacillus darangshiensis]